MRMTRASMYARVLESDASCNGRFFTGVLSTGIYCLPSCKARKPKPENVRFFPSCEAARAAGLRACRKCHPDDFARGADPVLEDIETVVSEIRAHPANFANVRSVVRRSGFGATRLFELFRQHYQTTPADLLLRARITAAKNALTSEGSPARERRDHGRDDANLSRSSRSGLQPNVGLLAVANAAGFESVSVFHEHFRAATGLTPAAYRELRTARSFRVALPPGYPLPYLRRALGRDPLSVTDRLQGDTFTSAIRLATGPTLLRMQLGPDAIEVELVTGSGSALEAHAVVVGLLGLEQDAAAFARLAKKLGLPRLVAGRPELRISQTPSVFDGLLWAIIGQQINFPFACQLKRRLIEKTGVPLAEGLYAPPTPEAVARLEPAELLPLQCSRQKADYVVATARLVAAGKLDLEGLRGLSATRAERTLLDIRGLGPWSVNYLMMRSLGLPDCVPLGDTGVTSGLQALLQLEERPDIDATRRLMTVFSPYRSLATAHLWQFNQPIPK